MSFPPPSEVWGQCRGPLQRVSCRDASVQPWAALSYSLDTLKARGGGARAVPSAGATGLPGPRATQRLSLVLEWGGGQHPCGLSGVLGATGEVLGQTGWVEAGRPDGLWGRGQGVPHSNSAAVYLELSVEKCLPSKLRGSTGLRRPLLPPADRAPLSASSCTGPQWGQPGQLPVLSVGVGAGPRVSPRGSPAP